jgi:hypothetical protein
MILKIVSSVVLALGIVILVVLVTLGGVIKQTINTSVTSRLKYKLPDGYKTNSSYEVYFLTSPHVFFIIYSLPTCITRFLSHYMPAPSLFLTTMI